MDLFEALVVLDAKGWGTLPARPDLADRAKGDLSRLVKRAGGLVAPDGRRFDFGCTDPLPDWFAPDRERWHLGEGVVVVDGGHVFELLESPRRVRVWGADVGAWLGALVHGTESGTTAPQPLADLAFDGDGWGWVVADWTLPTELDLAGLPTDLLKGPIAFDGVCCWVGDRIVEVVPTVGPIVEAPVGPDLEELFGAGSGRPRPRTALIGGLLGSGVVLTIVGMACINVPGGLLVLLAWMYVEKDMERVESGYLPEADRARVTQLRNVTYFGLLLVILLFALQMLLLCFGVYDVLLDEVYIPWWRAFIAGDQVLESP